MNVDRLATATVVECNVSGCGWRAEIPARYSLEHGVDGVVVTVDESAVLAFDAYLAGHLELHAIAETLLCHVDDPGPAEP